eukprot:m.527520 g.527520  ORF g.527520 m.527520 type:complete len:93 (+) comp57559_c0_seq28:1691-1969(+)
MTLDLRVFAASVRFVAHLYAWPCRLVLGHEDPLCYPLPDVGNSSSVCGGNNSMFASSNCSIECDTGFASTGDLVCNASAILSYVPRCLMLAE